MPGPLPPSDLMSCLHTLGMLDSVLQLMQQYPSSHCRRGRGAGGVPRVAAAVPAADAGPAGALVKLPAAGAALQSALEQMVGLRFSQQAVLQLGMRLLLPSAAGSSKHFSPTDARQSINLPLTGDDAAIKKYAAEVEALKKKIGMPDVEEVRLVLGGRGAGCAAASAAAGRGAAAAAGAAAAHVSTCASRQLQPGMHTPCPTTHSPAC